MKRNNKKIEEFHLNKLSNTINELKGIKCLFIKTLLINKRI